MILCRFVKYRILKNLIDSRDYQFVSCSTLTWKRNLHFDRIKKVPRKTFLILFTHKNIEKHVNTWQKKKNRSHLQSNFCTHANFFVPISFPAINIKIFRCFNDFQNNCWWKTGKVKIKLIHDYSLHTFICMI